VSSPISAVIFDLDGVLRHFDRKDQAAVEVAHGLEPGTIAAAAFSHELMIPLVTGQISRAQWGQALGEAIGSIPAAVDFLGKPAAVDREMIEIVEGLREQSNPPIVCLLTNGTDETAAELAGAEIDTCFDVIFNTADVGVAKPDTEIYAQVTEALGLSPNQIFFTDDSQRNVDAAHDFGWHAHRFEGRVGLRAVLEGLGKT